MVTTAEKTIIYHGVDRIDELMGYEPEASELHHHLYNEDYFIIGYVPAEEFLNEYGVFNAIDEVKQYEQVNFGEVITDFSNSEAVANMFAYIKGGEYLGNCQTLYDNWDSKLTDKQLKQIKQELLAQI